MGNGRRRTPEFRREAVRLALASGRARREITEHLASLPRCHISTFSSLDVPGRPARAIVQPLSAS